MLIHDAPNNLAKTIASTIGEIISDIPDPFSQTVGGVISVNTLVWPEHRPETIVNFQLHFTELLKI